MSVARGILALTLALAAAGCRTAPPAQAPPAVPAWAYPRSAPVAADPGDPDEAVGVPDSPVRIARRDFEGWFSAPDWFPAAHAAPPAVVTRGVPPDVYACGYCHTPGGQGRPENAALAGLPADYIRSTLADMVSGDRRSAAPMPDVPAARMARIAAHASRADIDAAAEYFAHERLGTRVVVHESARVPRLRVYAMLYGYDPSGGDEPLDGRLVEVASDIVRHERHDERVLYDLYVPPGSLARGATLVRDGTVGTPACAICHGAGLRGAAVGPPLAGRFGSYLLRQLLAFRAGTRAGEHAAPMQAVVAGLSLEDLVAASAYAASLPP